MDFLMMVFIFSSFMAGMSFLLAAAYSDWKDYRIPNKMVLLLAVTGIFVTYIIAPLIGGTAAVIMKLMNTAVFLVPFLILKKLGATNYGDIKLYLAVCLFLPNAESVVYLVMGFVAQMVVLIPVVYLIKKSYLIKEFPHALLFPVPTAAAYLLWLSSL